MLGNVQPGDRVEARDGAAGHVVEVLGPSPGRDSSILVRAPSGELVDVPASEVVDVRGGVVRIDLSLASLTSRISAPADMGGVEIDRLLAHEEVLSPRTVPADRGVVHVVRRIETFPVEETIETTRDDVVVEHVPVGQEIDQIPEIRVEGNTMIVPVVDEVVFTETRLILREEVRITRRQVTEDVVVRGEMRRERIDVVQEPPPVRTEPAAEV